MGLGTLQNQISQYFGSNTPNNTIVTIVGMTTGTVTIFQNKKILILTQLIIISNVAILSKWVKANHKSNNK